MLKNITRIPIRFTGNEDVVVLPLFEKELDLKGPAKKLDVLCKSGISNYIKKTGFKATAGETTFVGFQLPKAPGHVLLLGLGKRRSITPGRLADAAGSASAQLKSRGIATCHLLLGDVLGNENDDVIRSFLKGFALALYRFSMSSKPSRTKKLRKLSILTDDTRRIPRVIKQSRIAAESAARVRDLVNRPANDLTPGKMAAEAKSLADEHGLYCRNLDKKALQRLGMGAILGIGEGSREDPALITLHYNKGLSSRTKCPKVCYVGKGVTFDSGGISLKPWQNMNEMKGDMAGGAVVMHTLAAAARQKIPVELIGIIPCVENMPSGSAVRPGDVITTYSGKTIEVISTDAEGRLILADAITYALEFKPDLVLDIATLTGSVVIALGTRIAGIIGNNQGYVDKLLDAGKRTGEPVWQLPLDESFKQSVKGDISDLKNFAGRGGGTITAAALLGEFVGRTPWIHIDIAGTFWSPDGKISYQQKGATGFGVDLTLRFLESICGEESTV